VYKKFKLNNNPYKMYYSKNIRFFEKNFIFLRYRK